MHAAAPGQLPTMAMDWRLQLQRSAAAQQGPVRPLLSSSWPALASIEMASMGNRVPCLRPSTTALRKPLRPQP